MYLLDTNHASRIMDGRDASLVARIESVDPELLSICPIVSGELTFMVERSEKREENKRQLHKLVAILGMYDISDEVAKEYGRMKSALIDRFGPRDRRQKAATALRDIGVSDNDLWIAAVACRHGLVLVSRDGDFDRIAEVASLNRESWLSD